MEYYCDKEMLRFNLLQERRMFWKYVHRCVHNHSGISTSPSWELTSMLSAQAVAFFEKLGTAPEGCSPIRNKRFGSL